MPVMGTVVSIEVDAPDAAVTRAFDWFQQVEAVCSRFDAASELRQLPVGTPTAASPILFEAVRFALKVAHETDGAFDPTRRQPHERARLQPQLPHRRHHRCARHR